MIRSVKGMVALVTGGASGICWNMINNLLIFDFFILSGLGRATVQRLIDQGAKGVIALDRNHEEKFNSANVLAVTGSVVSEEDVSSALEKCKKEFGRLDAVVNCAGMIIKNDAFLLIIFIIIRCWCFSTNI